MNTILALWAACLSMIFLVRLTPIWTWEFFHLTPIWNWEFIKKILWPSLIHQETDYPPKYYSPNKTKPPNQIQTLEFMNDYTAILKKSREAASKYYRQQFTLATNGKETPECIEATELIDV